MADMRLRITPKTMASPTSPSASVSATSAAIVPRAPSAVVAMAASTRCFSVIASPAR